MNASFRQLALALSIALAAPGLDAQTWVALDGAPAGTPAEVRVLVGPSNTKRSSIEVIVHGFWSTDVDVPGFGIHQQLVFPGLQPTSEPGFPELAVAPLRLGIATDAAQVTPVFTSVAHSVDVPNVLPIPAPFFVEDLAGEPGDRMPLVFPDPAIYGGGSWPPDTLLGGDTQPFLAGFPAATVTPQPVSWNASTQTLTVIQEGVYLVDHFGNDLPALDVSRPTARSLEAALANTLQIDNSIQAFGEQVLTRYLILVPQGELWVAALEPFVELKKMQGYLVDVVELNTPADPQTIRSTIANWFTPNQPGWDQYVLIAADRHHLRDDDLIDLFPWGGGGGTPFKTDGTYSDVAASPGTRDVHVGRIPAFNASQLGQQLGKIVEYQADPWPGGHYASAVMVSGGSHVEYSEVVDSVDDAIFVTPFDRLALKAIPGPVSAADIEQAVEQGPSGFGTGIVAWRGEGSAEAWEDIDQQGGPYDMDDLGDLDNDVDPVVWSIADRTAKLSANLIDPSLPSSMCEGWLNNPHGASAAYGSVHPAGLGQTTENVLYELLFDRVFNHGLTTHAWAIESAEDETELLTGGGFHAERYHLLGDPSQVIRRDDNPLSVLGWPASVSLDDPPDEFDIDLLDSFGAAPPEGVLSVYKASFLGGLPDETLHGMWFDDDGSHSLDVTTLTPGTLFITALSVDGNQTTVEVAVEMGAAWTDAGQALPGAGHAPRLAGLGRLEADTPFSVLMADLWPGETVFVALGFAVGNAPLKGGVLVPDLGAPPARVLMLPADAEGDLVVPGTWPAGVPSGFEVVLQAWQADPSGPAGFIASNGLIATAP